MITIITWGAKFKKSFASKETHTYDIFSLYVHLSHFFSFCIQAKAIYTICTLTLFYSIFLFGKAQEAFENQRKIIHKQHHNHDNSYEYEKTFLVVENNVCILTLCVVCVKWLSYRGLWIEDRCCNNVWEIFRWFIHFSFKKIDTHWKERHVFKTSDSYTYYSVTYLNKFWLIGLQLVCLLPVFTNKVDWFGWFHFYLFDGIIMATIKGYFNPDLCIQTCFVVVCHFPFYFSSMIWSNLSKSQQYGIFEYKRRIYVDDKCTHSRSTLYEQKVFTNIARN